MIIPFHTSYLTDCTYMHCNILTYITNFSTFTDIAATVARDSGVGVKDDGMDEKAMSDSASARRKSIATTLEPRDGPLTKAVLCLGISALS